MIKDGKVYRNLEGQVEYLTEYLQSNAVAAELGIKVVGEAEDVSDIPAGEYDYGDAYMIGTEAPYEMYIWTRASGNHPEDFWFNIGHFPMPGPQGETGLGVDDVVSETVDITNAIATQTGDLTQFALTTTITETLTDNSSITIPTTINIPIKSDGQISIIANEYEHHGRETIQIGLNEYLPNTYLQQRTPGSSRVANQPMIYGYKNQGIKINNLSPLPIQFEENNVIMFPATGDAADNNILSSANSKWNTVLGKANSLSGGSGGNANTENLVFGGKNILHDGVQDSATFGYRNEVYANQAMTHGYKNTNKGGESFVQGTENQLLGNITIDTDPDEGYDGASSDTKASAVIGNKNIIQHGLKHSLVVGSQNTVNSGCQQIITIGTKNKIGKSCSWTNTFGDSNEIKNYATDSTVFGYENKVYGGADSSTPVQYVYMFGRNNENRDANGNARSYVWLLGRGLNCGGQNNVTVGAWNKGDMDEASAYFVVGTGIEGTPRTTLKVFDGETDFTGIIKIGNTSLSEAQLQSLLALI